MKKNHIKKIKPNKTQSTTVFGHKCIPNETN